MKDRAIAKSSMIAARMLDGEMIIMSAVDSTLFTLNDVATAIWHAADGSTSLENIVLREVCSEFDVEPSVALEDAEAFISELVSHGILLLSEAPGPHSQPEPRMHLLDKKPYAKPSFRFERAFETMALSCGKVNPTQLQCKFNLKNS